MQENINALSKNGSVLFYGRTYTDPRDGRIWFNWSGSGFEFSFTGTSASAYLHTDLQGGEVRRAEERAYIGVFVDGSDIATARFPLDSEEGFYTLTEDLPFGSHTVKVIKETEAGYGRSAVSKIECDGVFTAFQSEKKLKIEFIGDSITCGYGNICSNKSPDFVTGEEDFSLTYAALTAGFLGAELSCVAASGNGFFHDYGCNTHNLIPEMYIYTDKMLCENYGFETEKWDFTADRVDAVVIKLGQNDAQYCMGADLEESARSPEILNERRREFEKTAAGFLIKLAELRAGVPIFSVYEPEMYLASELEAAMHEAGKQIIPVPVSGKRSYEGVGANGHWAVCTHARAALLLAERMRAELCLP